MAEVAINLPKLDVQEPKDLPPANFEPLTANPQELEHYWLPPRPDPALQPELYEHWSEMLSPTPTFVRAQSTPPIIGIVAPTTEVYGVGRGASRLQNSRNWSGAFVNSIGNKPFTRVVGQWTVPAVSAGVRDSLDPAKLRFQCSVWIGLDGKKRWSNSMPQVGTAQLLEDDGTRDQYLWWQWWERAATVASQNVLPWRIEGVPVRAGDLVLCSLMVSAPKTVRIHVVNRTSGLFATVQLTKAPIDGATAEWVVERPAAWKFGSEKDRNGPLYPLPDYGEVVFDHCAAEHDAPPTRPGFLPRLIRMKQRFAQYNRVAVISAPSTRNLTPRRLKLRYQRPD